MGINTSGRCKGEVARSNSPEQTTKTQAGLYQLFGRWAKDTVVCEKFPHAFRTCLSRWKFLKTRNVRFCNSSVIEGKRKKPLAETQRHGEKVLQKTLCLCVSVRGILCSPPRASASLERITIKRAVPQFDRRPCWREIPRPFCPSIRLACGRRRPPSVRAWRYRAGFRHGPSF